MVTKIFTLLLLVPLLSSCATQLISVTDKLQGTKNKTPMLNPQNLDEECVRIAEVLPLLTLTVMMEGPMDCGHPEYDSEPVPRDQFDSAAEKQARARRLQIRKVQEKAAREANEACIAYQADRTDTHLRTRAEQAVARSRETDSGQLPDQND